MRSLPGEIETFTGRRVRPLELRAGDVIIEDIAHALSQQCRFAGHSREFISVAQHSVVVSRLLELWGSPYQLVGLLHDASEAYLVDVPVPLKCLPEFAGYRAAEERAEQVIARVFGLPHPLPSLVQEADRVVLATEWRDLMSSIGDPAGPKPLPSRITSLPPRAAEQLFLERFHHLYRFGDDEEGCTDRIAGDAATTASAAMSPSHISNN